MSALFFYGTLCHPPVLQKVLQADRAQTVRPATLMDARVHWVQGAPIPMITKAPGHQAAGVILPEVTAQDLARLDHYEGGFDYATVPVTVQTQDGTVDALVYWPAEDLTPAEPWSLEAWVSRYSTVTLLAADEIMAGFGTVDPKRIAARMSPIRARAQARANAQLEPSPATLRRATQPGDLVIEAAPQRFTGFFAVEELTYRHKRFDGSLSGPLTREMFISADSATVLPYDPVTDLVAVIEQPRPVPLLRHDPEVWLIEPIAGRIDAWETPEDAARRETQEEAGLELDRLIEVARYYPSPGAFVEFLYSYIGLTSLSSSSSHIGGLDTEDEDIRRHILPFDDLMGLITTTEVRTATLILSALCLSQMRPELRAEAGA